MLPNLATFYPNTQDNVPKIKKNCDIICNDVDNAIYSGNFQTKIIQLINY